MTLEEALLQIDSLSNPAWLFLPRDEPWNLASRAAVLEMDEVAPDEEDLPDAGTPQYAREDNLVATLDVGTVQSIIENLKFRTAQPTAVEMFEAFDFYYRNDAFIVA